MPDFSSPIWTFIGIVVSAIIGILGIAASIFVYKRSKEKKIIIWDIDFLSILSAFQRTKNVKIQAFFKDQPLEDACLLEINIRNAGNKEITSGDYERPIKFIFQKGKVLDLELVSMKPKDIVEKEEDLVSTSSETSIELNSKIALNPNSDITFRVLVAPSISSADITQNGKLIGGSIQSLINTELSSLEHIPNILSAYSPMWYDFLSIFKPLLPVAITLGTIAFILYHFFGIYVLTYAVKVVGFSFMFILFPLCFWFIMYQQAKYKLIIKNNRYKPILLFLLSGIIPILWITYALYLLFSGGTTLGN